MRRFHPLIVAVLLGCLLPAVHVAADAVTSAADEAATLCHPLPDHPHEAPGPDRRHLVLLVTSGLSGHYSDGSRTIAGLVATLQVEAQTARDHGHDVVVLDAGRTLVPYAESRADEGTAMGEVLAGLDAAAFAPAPMDLTLGLRRVAALASEMAGLPTLRAFDSDDPAVSALEPRALVELGGERPLTLEVRSLFDRVFLGDLETVGVAADYDRIEELSKELDPDTLRLLVVHSRGFGDTLVDRRLTWEMVREPHGFDLLLDPDLGHDMTLERRIEPTAGGADDGDGSTANAGSVFLAGRALDTGDPWTYSRIDVDLHWHAPSARWRPTSIALEVRRPCDDIAVDADLERRLLTAFGDFRRDWHLDLEDGAPTDRQHLVDFALRALREATHAEIALVNRGVLRPVADEHWTAPLTRETVLRLLTLDQELDVGYLTGAQLRQLATISSGRVDADGQPTGASLVFVGLSWLPHTGSSPSGSSPSGSSQSEVPDPKSFRVNGRPLYDDDLYRVVTNSFLTSGGDNYPILAAMEAERQELDGEPLEARDDIVLPRLDEPLRPLYDPLHRPLWRFGVDPFALDLHSVSVDADPAYSEVSDSRASASDTSQARLDLHLFANQDWPLLRWENRLRVRFGLVETDAIEELVDDLRFEVSAVFHKSPWKQAEPYLSYLFDSELRRNEDHGVELPRQHEQSLAAGLSWKTERWPRLRLGLVARHQDDAEVADRFGFVGEAWYRKPTVGGRPGVSIDALVESVEDDDAIISRVDLDLRLEVALGAGVLLTPGVEVYRYDDSRLDGAAEYHSLALGLRWRWIQKIQR